MEGGVGNLVGLVIGICYILEGIVGLGVLSVVVFCIIFKVR